MHVGGLCLVSWLVLVSEVVSLPSSGLARGYLPPPPSNPDCQEVVREVDREVEMEECQTVDTEECSTRQTEECEEVVEEKCETVPEEMCSLVQAWSPYYAELRVGELW